MESHGLAHCSSSSCSRASGRRAPTIPLVLDEVVERPQPVVPNYTSPSQDTQRTHHLSVVMLATDSLEEDVDLISGLRDKDDLQGDRQS